MSATHFFSTQEPIKTTILLELVHGRLYFIPTYLFVVIVHLILVWASYPLTFCSIGVLELLEVETYGTNKTNLVLMIGTIASASNRKHIIQFNIFLYSMEQYRDLTIQQDTVPLHTFGSCNIFF